jgi:hypothetical protein
MMMMMMMMMMKYVKENVSPNFFAFIFASKKVSFPRKFLS